VERSIPFVDLSGCKRTYRAALPRDDMVCLTLFIIPV
jgi:hypothetical protein